MDPRTVPFMTRMLPLLCLFWVSAPVVAFDEPYRPDDSAAQESREEKSEPWKLTVGHDASRGAPDATPYYILLVADDRLGTGQWHLHLVGRWPTQSGGRLAPDVLAKRGLGEDFQGAPQFIRSGDMALGYDAPSWFARLVRDQRPNFGPSDAWRFSIGSRS